MRPKGALLDLNLIAELVLLIVVANGAPVLAKRALGARLDRPLDGGTVLADGRPPFGPTKTIRGVALSLLATPLAAELLGLPWKVGALVAGAAIAGDLFSSFMKRRLGLPPSSMAIGLDQIPESLLPLLASRVVLPVGWLDIVVGVIIFFGAELVLSRILFKLRLRDKPY